jgi:hypothetical protein
MPSTRTWRKTSIAWRKNYRSRPDLAPRGKSGVTVEALAAILAALGIRANYPCSGPGLLDKRADDSCSPTWPSTYKLTDGTPTLTERTSIPLGYRW